MNLQLRYIHFIGIGGSGISALAYLALSHGIKVSGSDAGENPTTKNLQKLGAEIQIGHKAENINEFAELVIYTEAIDRETNPEYLHAQAQGIRTLSYFEALGEMSMHKKTIAVAGTHGKTTTTAMLGQAMIEAGLDPTVIVGSVVPAFDNKNIRVGHSEWLVVEACEYRRSFLNFQPFGMVVLNCELEHIDYYKDEADYISAFRELAEKLPKEGFLIFNSEDKNASKVTLDAKSNTTGIHSRDTAEIKLQVPGKFNLMNAAHAKAAAMEAGGEESKVLEGLHKFTGTARRMELKGEKDGVLVMDDYGHHPTEVRATLGALKEKHPSKRLICVFQPHQYSRTRELLEEFTESFESADEIIIPNIFEARDSEEDKASISAEKLAQKIPNANHGNGFENTLAWLRSNVVAGDIVLTMGAGDVYKIGEDFLK